MGAGLVEQQLHQLERALDPCYAWLDCEQGVLVAGAMLAAELEDGEFASLDAQL